MGLLGLPVPGPGDAVRAATGLYAALDQAVALVPRIAVLVGRLELLTARADSLIGEIDAVQAGAAAVVDRTTGVIDAVEQVVAAAAGTIGRVDAVIDGAQAVVGRSNGVVDDATATVQRTAGVVGGAEDLLGRSDAIVGRILATTSDDEIQAVVHLIDTLPDAVDALRNDVLPVMSTLGTVAPDLRDLLDIASQLNGVLGSVPGLGRLRKRVEKAQAEEDGEHYRADEEPPTAPDRH